MLGGLRSSFLTGVVVVLPVGLTAYVIWTVTGWIDGFVLPLVPQAWRPDVLIQRWFGQDTFITIRGIGVMLFLIFTILVGWVAKGIIGRSLIRWGEHLVDRTPVVRSIYGGVKQIAETVFAQADSNFDRACLLQFPREGSWAIGFVSTRARGEIALRIPTEEPLITVFVPTTPNPTSGFLVYVPEREVIYLDMKIEDAAKLIISAGLVYPGPREDAAPPR
ncbi:MAG: DUF502 domain-containing protein [Rhodobacterales bacterium]|nr:DUF502 domain-containing protein [Rhodobacterales bacterium]